MKKIKKAVIPIAGLGTRFLPVTKSVAKEMLPIVDKPTLQYIVEECVESGIEEILFVTSPYKKNVEDHFDQSFELENRIEKSNKLTIYLSPFTPLSLDRHNHISTTDLRLLRRMVRDYNHRGYSAEKTMIKWLEMRKSEEKNIYPYQRKTDMILNTSLSYEIGVLRTYVEPLLYSINPESVVYEEAIRVLNFLKGFMNIPSDDIPSSSVLREFIGNSYFE